MEQFLPREVLWADKTTMGSFLNETLNQKLYQVYLGIKKKAPSQDFRTLELFNEVYYICSRIVNENLPEVDLNPYIQEIKRDLGWDYPTSIVLNMIYAVLALREDNSIEVKNTIRKIREHYKMDHCKSPFSVFVDDEISKGQSYRVEFEDLNKIDLVLLAKCQALKFAGAGKDKTIIQNITIENKFEKPVGAVVIPGAVKVEKEINDFVKIKKIK